MKQLNDILTGVKVLESKGSFERPVEGISFDSRQVSGNHLFVAVPGTRVDGHNFIEQAVGKGATTIVCEKLPGSIEQNKTYIRVESSAQALGKIASNFFGNPSDQLRLVGITGTNGKTTTATLLFNLFRKLGYQAGLLSTVSNRIGNHILASTHTTPDAVQIQGTLKNMVDEGCEYAFMEVSSHAIDQERIAGLNFTGAIFTNITHDHLDYHHTFKNYLAAKKKLFDNLQEHAFALSNADDKNGSIMLQNSAAKKFTYGLKKLADFNGKVIENHFSGMQIQLDGHEVHTLLTGTFNAYNMLAAYATAVLLNQKQDEILTALSSISGAEGRFELVRSKNKITGIVDYAHTPDALKNILESINTLRTKNERLITVIGAGGDRDREKRPRMASIASILSDMVILTSDNPRSEDPVEIIKEMKKGIEADRKNKTLVITDRKEAIKTAVSLAHPGDLVLVAGKGHEKYQEIKGQKFPFDDKQLLTEFLENI